MGTFTREAAQLYLFLPASLGISFYRNEFAYLGGNSSLKNRPHFPAQTGSSQVFPFVEMAEKQAEGLDKMQMLTV